MSRRVIYIKDEPDDKKEFHLEDSPRNESVADEAFEAKRRAKAEPRTNEGGKNAGSARRKIQDRVVEPNQQNVHNRDSIGNDKYKRKNKDDETRQKYAKLDPEEEHASLLHEVSPSPSTFDNEIFFNPDESIPTNLGRDDPPGCYPEQSRLHKSLIEGKWHEAYSFLLDPAFVLPTMEGYPKVEEVGFVDSCGSLPLHIAVGIASEVRAPFKVVSLLLEKGPTYAKVRHPFSGDLPLHLSCHPLIRPDIVNSQSWPRLKIEPASDLETIIQIIHEQYPEAVREKTGDETSFPLHILLEHQPPLSLVKRFLTSTTGGLSILTLKDDDQRVPLHVAIENHASADVIEQLLDFRSARTCRMKHGETPLHVAAFHGCTLKVLQALLAEPGAIALPCNKAGKGDNFDGSNMPLHVLFHPNLKSRWMEPLDTTLAPRRDHRVVARPLNCLHPSDMFRYMLKTHAQANEDIIPNKKQRADTPAPIPEHLRRARSLLLKKNQAKYTVIKQAEKLAESCIAKGQRVPTELQEVLEQLKEITSGSPLYKEWPHLYEK